MSQARIKLFAWVLIIGSLLWSMTECMEIIGGTLSQLSMFITGIAFLALLVGVWGVHAGQAVKGGTASLIGTACVSIAYLVFMGGSFSVLRSVLTYEGVAATDWIFVGFFFLIFGAPLLGISILRGRVYPAWTGAVFIVSPLVTTTTFTAGLLPVLMNIANIAIGISFITIGRQLLVGKAEPLAAKQ